MKSQQRAKKKFPRTVTVAEVLCFFPARNILLVYSGYSLLLWVDI